MVQRNCRLSFLAQVDLNNMWVTLYSWSDESVTVQYYGQVIGNDVLISGSVSGNKVQYYSDGRISMHMYRLVIPGHSIEPLCAKLNISWSPEDLFNELSKRFSKEFMCSAISNFMDEAGLEHEYTPSSRG